MSWLAFVGVALVLGSWVAYMATVPSGKVPVRPWGHLGTQVTGAALSVVGIAVALQDGGELGGGALVAGGLALTMAGLFVFLYSQRATPVGKITVHVGAPLRTFSALTWEGQAFDSSAFDGRRVLLKFFRGHW